MSTRKLKNKQDSKKPTAIEENDDISQMVTGTNRIAIRRNRRHPMSITTTTILGSSSIKNQIKDSTSMKTFLKRLYIGGLSDDVTSNLVEDRFKSFGKVQDVKIALNDEGKCRGFAHLSIETNEANLKKCLHIYNKSKWKGMQLKVEEAKQDFLQKLELERPLIKQSNQNLQDSSEQQSSQKKKNKKRSSFLKKNKKKNKLEIVHASNMSLVKDTDKELREGWKRGKFGRPVAVIKVKDKATGKIVQIDPSTLQHHLKRLKDNGYDEVPDNMPSKALEYMYQYDADQEEVERKLKFRRTAIYSEATSAPYHDQDSQVPSVDDAMLSNDHEDQEEKHVDKQTSSYTATVVVDGSNNIVYQDNVNKRNYLSSSDEEEVFNDVDIIDKQEQQNNKHEDYNDEQETETKRLDDQGLKEEKEFTMSIMNKLFGPKDTPAPLNTTSSTTDISNNNDSKQQQDRKSDDAAIRLLWKPPVRFDPTTPNASEFVLPDEEEENDSEHNIKTNESTTDGHSNQPVVAQVNTNLRSLVFGDPNAAEDEGNNENTEGTSLFSFSKGFGFAGNDEDDEEPGKPFGGTFGFKLEKDEQSSIVNASISSQHVSFSTSSLFFMHFDHPECRRRSIYRPTFSFKREKTMDLIYFEWEQNKQELTEEYKRKHRSTFRKKRKIVKTN